MTDTHLKIANREESLYEIEAPIDMNMPLTEVARACEITQDDEIGVYGGMAMCTSCQYYVQNEETVTPPEVGEEEQAMLSEAFHVKSNSRLGCQMPITPELDGLEVILTPLSWENMYFYLRFTI